MNTTTLLQNLKYIALGLILAGSFGLVHAQFNPSVSAPGNTIATPLHTGPDQIKDGGLSVNTFFATQNAAFQQQTFLNSIVRGGSPSDTDSAIVIGDASAPANIAVNGAVSAKAFLQSSSIANNDSSALCATATGALVTCDTGPTAPAPTLTQVGPNAYNGSGETVQLFAVGPSVLPGDTFTMAAYYHTITVTAAPGDNTEIIVQKLVAAINGPNDWAENPYTDTTSRPGDGSAAPSAGTAGYPPTASTNAQNASYFTVTLDHNHQFYIHSAAR